MEERRTPPLSTILFFLLMFLFMFSGVLEVSPVFFIVLVVVVVVLITVLSMRSRPYTPRRRGVPPDFEGPHPPRPFRSIPPPRIRIGRWLIIPIAFAGVIGFILFQNWWLTVRILQSMYTIKAGLDWWKISFLNNYYFYACIGVGLLVALSDPRIIIAKNEEGRRKIYLHSKFWGLVNALMTQFVGSGEDYFSTPKSIQQAWDDKISLKRGVLWKVAEFTFGASVIGPAMAQNLAFNYLLIANQGISWISVIQRSFSVLYVRLLTSEMPTGAWLLENSPIIEFLNWIRTPMLIFGAIWAVRLVISFVFELRKGKISKSLRAITLIGLIILTYMLIQIPSWVFDITTPLYIRSMVIGEIVLIGLAVFFSLHEIWVQSAIRTMYMRKIYLIILIVIVLGGVLSGPIQVVAQYAPSMQGQWQNWVWTPAILPAIQYTEWATGVDQVRELNSTTAMNTGENLGILSKIRAFYNVSAALKLMPDIGATWMDITTTDIIWSGGTEYWIAPLTIRFPSGDSIANQWLAERLSITHSERILTLNAATGEVVSFNSVFNITSSVSMYYGEGGLFSSSDMVYVDVPGFQEFTLSGNPVHYTGKPDYTLSGVDRFWFFSGIYGKESLHWDFGSGQYGDINMLYLRDINERLSPILLPGMSIDSDPTIVCDPSGNIYYALCAYVDRTMPTSYLYYPNYPKKSNFLRLFATVLINTYTGSISGYILNSEDNYIMNFYRGMYQQWSQPVPGWLTSQLRYPEDLLDRQIDSYNMYHVLDPDIYRLGTGFFQLTTNANNQVIEDVRYVDFYLSNKEEWAGVRLVEGYKSIGKNLAGLYVALNGDKIGQTYFIRVGNMTIAGPQVALDTITQYNPTQSLLTFNPTWKYGNVLLYVIEGKPYYFIPYYASSAKTSSPAMVVAVDALSKKVGYYVIKVPTDAAEVGLASAQAYANLLGVGLGQTKTTVLTAEQRKQNIINELRRQGYIVNIPTQLSLPLEYQNASISYHSDADWAAANSTISAFITTWVAPYYVDSIGILMREPVVSGVKYLDLGVPVNKAGIIEFHYIRVDYS